MSSTFTNGTNSIDNSWCGRIKLDNTKLILLQIYSVKESTLKKELRFILKTWSFLSFVQLNEHEDNRIQYKQEHISKEILLCFISSLLILK